MEPGRLANLGLARGNDQGAVRLRPTRILRPTAQRALSSPAQENSDADAGVVERRGGAALESSVRLPASRGPEDPAGGSTGSALGSLLARSGFVRALADASDHDQRPVHARGRLIYLHERRLSGVAPCRREDRIRKEWPAGIHAAVLAKVGHNTNTGAAEGATRLILEPSWAQSTWTTRASQIARWLRFCDDGMRCPLPASEVRAIWYFIFCTLVYRYEDYRGVDLHFNHSYRAPLVAGTVAA